MANCFGSQIYIKTLNISFDILMNSWLKVFFNIQFSYCLNSEMAS